MRSTSFSYSRCYTPPQNTVSPLARCPSASPTVGTADRFQWEVNMESIQGPVLYLLIACGVVTAAFLGLLIWKSLLESHEDDQIFLGTTEQHLDREQQLLVAKINTLSRPLMMTGILAGVLLLSAAGVWV